MARTTTHLIAQPKPAPRIQRAVADEFTAHQARMAKAKREAAILNLRGDNPTRCSKCPKEGSCSTCATINAHRVSTGLLVPREDPAPHRWACLIPVTHGPHSDGNNGPMRARRYPVIQACVVKRGGGWRVGVARLDGADTYVGRPTRDNASAWEWAKRRASDLREGLNYASSVGA
jgi:hypothetical protein